MLQYDTDCGVVPGNDLDQTSQNIYVVEKVDSTLLTCFLLNAQFFVFSDL